MNVTYHKVIALQTDPLLPDKTIGLEIATTHHLSNATFQDAQRYPLKLVRLSVLAQGGLPVADGVVIDQDLIRQYGLAKIAQALAERYKLNPVFIRSLDDDLKHLANKGTTYRLNAEQVREELEYQIVLSQYESTQNSLTVRERVASILPYLTPQQALEFLIRGQLEDIHATSLIQLGHQASHSGIISIYPDQIVMSYTQGTQAPSTSILERSLCFNMATGQWSQYKTTTRINPGLTLNLPENFDYAPQTGLLTVKGSITNPEIIDYLCHLAVSDMQRDQIRQFIEESEFGKFNRTLLDKILSYTNQIRSIFDRFEPNHSVYVVEYSANLTGIPDSPEILMHQIRPTYLPITERAVNPTLQKQVIRWGTQALPLVGVPLVITTEDDLKKIQADTIAFIDRELLSKKNIIDQITLLPRAVITDPIARNSHASLQLESLGRFAAFVDHFAQVVDQIERQSTPYVQLTETFDTVTGKSEILLDPLAARPSGSKLKQDRNETILTYEKTLINQSVKFQPDDFDPIPGKENVHRQINGKHLFLPAIKLFQRLSDEDLIPVLLNDLRLTFLIFPEGLAAYTEEQSHFKMRQWVSSAGFPYPTFSFRAWNSIGDRHEDGLGSKHRHNFLQVSNQYAGDYEVYIKDLQLLIDLLFTLKTIGIPFNHIKFSFEEVDLLALLSLLKNDPRFDTPDYYQIAGIYPVHLNGKTFLVKTNNYNLVSRDNIEKNDYSLLIELYRVIEDNSPSTTPVIKEIRPGIYNLTQTPAEMKGYDGIINFLLAHHLL